MRRLVSTTLFMFISLAVVVAFGPRAYAESVGCGPEYVKQTSAHIDAVTKAITAYAAKGQCDQAIALLKQYDPFPLTPDAAEARLTIAKALRKAKRFSEAANLLKLTAARDPYNRFTPESLSLLTSILYFDLKDRTEYGDYMAKLAMEYYPKIPEVVQARASFGNNLPVVLISQKILLDESLGEASIFSRFFLGSSNFCQWDVIRTLGEGGFIVHDNFARSSGGPTLDVMRQYGLVIVNGGPQTGRAMSSKTIADIVSYVGYGGKLLVVCGGTNCGGGSAARVYNPLLRKLGMTFDESYTSKATHLMCKPVSHPLMRGVNEFQSTAGTRVSGGTPLGYCGSEVIMSTAKFGKGVVVAAGIGTGFMGNTIGDLYRDTPAKKAEAQINRTFLLKLVQNMTAQSGTSIRQPSGTVERSGTVTVH